MSLLFTPSVRKGRAQHGQSDKKLLERTLAILMDMPSFSAIRDYCIRHYFPAASVAWIATKGIRESSVWNYGGTPASIPMNLFDHLCSSALSIPGSNGGAIDISERVRLRERYGAGFCEIWSGPAGPYEKVGALMHFVLTMHGQESGTINLWHKKMRLCMTQWLNALVCDEYKKQPGMPAWDVLPSVTLANIAREINARMPRESLSTVFTNNVDDRMVWLRDGATEKVLPKTAGEFVTAAAIRKEIISELSPGQLQMTTPWLRNGMQINGFSWRNFSLFLERHYVMTATDGTFDKAFFCEMIARGGAAWSTPAFEEKYNAVWDLAYTEWASLAQVVIPGQPNLAISARMSSLPVKVQRKIAVDTVALWPGMVLSQECMNLARPLIEKDSALEARIKKSEFNMGVRQTFDLLYKPPVNQPGVISSSNDVRNLGGGGASEWPMYEHLAIRYAEMVPVMEAEPLPADVTGYFSF